MKKIDPAPPLNTPDVEAWTTGVYEHALRLQSISPEIQQTESLIQVLHGRSKTSGKPSMKLSSALNKIPREWWEFVAFITDLEPDVSVRIPKDVSTYSGLQTLLEELLQVYARTSDYQFSAMLMTMYSLLHTGYMKIQWNPAAKGGLGEQELIPKGPTEILQIGARHDIQEAEVVIEVEDMTMDKLARIYGDKARLVRPDVGPAYDREREYECPPSFTDEQWKYIPTEAKAFWSKRATPNKRSSGVYARVKHKLFWLNDPSVNETSETILMGPKFAPWSYYAEPGTPLYRRKRLIAKAGDVILRENPNPYYHGKFPYVMMRAFPVPWQFHGMSLFGHLNAMQEGASYILYGLMENIRAGLEPRLIAQKNALTPSQWDSYDPRDPPAKLMFSNRSTIPPKFAEPPAFPALSMNVLQMIDREMDMTSGASAISQALTKKQVPGGDALETIKSSRSYMIRLVTRSLERALRQIGTMTIQNMLQFYTLENRINMLGAAGISPTDSIPEFGSLFPKGMAPESFVKRFEFILEPGSLLSLDQTEVEFKAREMFKLGLISRRQALRMLKMNIDFDLNEQELVTEAEQKVGIAGMAATAAKRAKTKK